METPLSSRNKKYHATFTQKQRRRQAKRGKEYWKKVKQARNLRIIAREAFKHLTKYIGRKAVHDSSGKYRYSHEGDFSLMLRMAGLTQERFSKIAGCSETAVNRWHGYPPYGWPVNFMKLYLWAKAMERELALRGVDTDAMKPKLENVPLTPKGRANARLKEVENARELTRAAARSQETDAVGGLRRDPAELPI